MKKLFIATSVAAVLLSSCNKERNYEYIDTGGGSTSGVTHDPRFFGRGGGGTGGTGNFDGIDMGSLMDYTLVFSSGQFDANWQGATKGFAGDVAVNGLVANERTSGGVPFAGTITTNDNSLNGWQGIVNQNSGQATVVYNDSATIADLGNSIENVFQQVNNLTPTPGYESRTPQSLDGLNTQNGISETFVINITSGFQVSTQIDITGDADDYFILKWDTDATFYNGYSGQVKFQSGGAIVPHRSEE